MQQKTTDFTIRHPPDQWTQYLNFESGFYDSNFQSNLCVCCYFEDFITRIKIKVETENSFLYATYEFMMLNDVRKINASSISAVTENMNIPNDIRNDPSVSINQYYYKTFCCSFKLHAIEYF